MKSLLLFLCGALAAHALSPRAKKPVAPKESAELAAIAAFSTILDDLERDMGALLALHEKHIKKMLEDLDAKLFHTHTNPSPVFLH